MGGKSKPATSTTNQTTTNAPWAPASGALEGMITSAQGAYDATPKTPVFTGPNADQTAAVDYLRGQAGATATGADEMRALAQQTASGYFLSPDTNPYIKQAVEAAIRPLQQQLDGRIVSVGDAATMAGAYGGDRQALLKAKALTGFNEAALDTSGQIYFNNYNNERQRQMGAGALFNDANALALKPGQVLSSIGDQQQQWDIAAATAAMDAPWAGLDRLQSVLSGVQDYGTQTTDSKTVSQGAKASGAQGALGGALGGASAGSAFGPWGAGIGAVIGGLGGLFG